ncbi:hypothetical protein FOZ60_006069 [Perkinsus olseni]|uniref:Uncharacterized protein n=2 Tax=Perkinsus olseni TaxID=32597 RepID=A0A7J6NPM2_PEROL|nr:hypothetical protein FOZ60_006069 [Perkinsus olseni]
MLDLNHILTCFEGGDPAHGHPHHHAEASGMVMNAKAKDLGGLLRTSLNEDDCVIPKRLAEYADPLKPFDSGTDGPVYIQLHGYDKHYDYHTCSGWYLLKQHLKAGRHYAVSVLGPDVGPVKQIDLHNPTDDDWFAGTVLVKRFTPEGSDGKDPMHSDAWAEFKVNKWLVSPDHSEESVVRTATPHFVASDGPEGTVLRYINGQPICQPTGPKAEIQSLLERYLLQKQSALKEQLEKNSATTQAVQAAEKFRVEAIQVVDHAINTLNLLTNDKWPVGDKTDHMQFLQTALVLLESYMGECRSGVRATNPERDELDVGTELMDRLYRRKQILQDNRDQISLTLTQAASSQVEQCRAFGNILVDLRDSYSGTKWQMLRRGPIVQIFLFPYDLSVLRRSPASLRSSELRDATIDNSMGSSKYIAAIYPANSARGMDVALKFPASISREVEARMRLTIRIRPLTHEDTVEVKREMPTKRGKRKRGQDDGAPVDQTRPKAEVPPVVPSSAERAAAIDEVSFEGMMNDRAVQASGWAWGSGQHESRPHYSKPDISGSTTPQIHLVHLPKSIQLTISLEPLHKLIEEPMSPLEELAAAEMKHRVLDRLAHSYDPELATMLTTPSCSASRKDTTLLDEIVLAIVMAVGRMLFSPRVQQAYARMIRTLKEVMPGDLLTQREMRTALRASLRDNYHLYPEEAVVQYLQPESSYSLYPASKAGMQKVQARRYLCLRMLKGRCCLDWVKLILAEHAYDVMTWSRFSTWCEVTLPWIAATRWLGTVPEDRARCMAL